MAYRIASIVVALAGSSPAFAVILECHFPEKRFQSGATVSAEVSVYDIDKDDPPWVKLDGTYERVKEVKATNGSVLQFTTTISRYSGVASQKIEGVGTVVGSCRVVKREDRKF